MMLTQDELKRLLHYDPDTGIFTRAVKMRKFPKGSRVGWIGASGYVYIHLRGKYYLAHRLAWFYVKGVWPKADIDHRNGVRSDNIWKNLRQSTRSKNMQNLGGHYKNNQAKALGVYWSKYHGKWCSRLTVDKKTHFLGYFDELWEASAAYLTAKDRLHPTHLRLRGNHEQVE